MTATISGLFCYPIKSCAGISLSEVVLDKYGVAFDRFWMLVDAQHKFMSQRTHPKMALIKTAFVTDGIQVTAPDMSTLTLNFDAPKGDLKNVTVWSDSCNALDEGDEVAAWFSDFLNTPCRLVRRAQNYQRIVDNDHVSPKHQTREVGFADGFPLLLISEASLADLNARLEISLPMARFRPNIVVSGCEPYAEDSWQTFSVGEEIYYGVKHCQRCAITTTCQDTAERGKEPLKTLATYRKNAKGGVIFGQNVLHGTYPARLAVGNVITV